MKHLGILSTYLVLYIFQAHLQCNIFCDYFSNICNLEQSPSFVTFFLQDTAHCLWYTTVVFPEGVKVLFRHKRRKRD